MDRVRWHAWEAYASCQEQQGHTVDTWLAAGGPAAHAMLESWVSAYTERTEPTWNECAVLHTGAGGVPLSPYHFNSLYVRTIAEGTTLIESSDYLGHQPGWYEVKAFHEFDAEHLPHVPVRRVYPEGDPTELVYLRRTYRHPSREYALDVARQILTREVFFCTWRNPIRMGLARLGLPTWLTPDKVAKEITHAFVFRIPEREGDPYEDMVIVNREYLRARGQWKDASV